MLHRRGRDCVPQGWDLPQELGGLLDEQSLHGLPYHEQGYPLGCKLSSLGTQLQNADALSYTARRTDPTTCHTHTDARARQLVGNSQATLNNSATLWVHLASGLMTPLQVWTRNRSST